MQSKASHNSSLEAAESTKKELINFMKKIEESSNEDIIEVIRDNISIDLISFEEDISAVLFFKDIYDKTAFYFKIVRASLASEISSVILKVDSEIAVLQEERRKMEEIERKLKQKEE